MKCLPLPSRRRCFWPCRPQQRIDNGCQPRTFGERTCSVRQAAERRSRPEANIKQCRISGRQERYSEAFAERVADRFHVAAADGRVVGTGMIDLATGKFDAVFVLPGYTGRGVGRAMPSVVFPPVEPATHSGRRQKRAFL
ncbi:MAG TPA: GNAT family N-acetyltransferase [Rhodanobacter sp.]|nr:GNAT family N-acetyltransferase [Rhodanobacter sp.]